MKTTFIVSAFVMISIELLGQSANIKITENQKIIGQNLVTQKEIVAKEYQFSKHIYRRYLDSASGNLTLQLRKFRKLEKAHAIQGHIAVFSLNAKNLNWSTKMNYSMGRVRQYGNLITMSRENKVFYLNNDTGTEIWNDKNDLYHVDKNNNIGIQYIKNDNYKIQGIDLDTGNSLWQRDLNREFGWNDVKTINDSTLLIAAGGIHQLNVRNGTGWSYNAVTGKKDYKETIAKNAAGVALGVLTGTAVLSSGPNLVRNLSSNVLLDSNYVYFGSRQGLAKINRIKGDIIWEYVLDENLTSKSSIFVKDDLIYLINKGYADFGNRKINFGDPFITALNSKTGKQEFVMTVGNDNDFILDYKLIDDTLLLLLKDRILKASLLNNTVIKEKVFNIADLGELNFFTSDIIFKQEGNSLFNLIGSDSTKYFIQTKKNFTLEMDDKFNFSNQYFIKDLYIYYNEVSDFKFFIKGDRDKTIITDKENRMIAQINLPGFIFAFGDSIYAIDGKSLYEIEIRAIHSIRSD